jgi:hypothetical protein
VRLKRVDILLRILLEQERSHRLEGEFGGRLPANREKSENTERGDVLKYSRQGSNL